MKKFLFITSLLTISTYCASRVSAYAYSLSPNPTTIDSIGVEKKNGKRFILHRVDQGQTLYSIARRYGRSVADIKAANPDLNESVRYAQVVRVPIPDGSISRSAEKAIDKAIRTEAKEKKKAERAAAKADVKTDAKSSDTGASTAGPETSRDEATDDPARSGIHVVKAGQTLYSLAVRYGVPQSDLRRWNNLGSNNVLIGQALIVSEKAYQARVPASAPAEPVRTPDTPARATTPPRPVEPKPTEPRPTSPARRTEEPKTERAAPAPTTDTRRTETTASTTRPVEAKPTEPEEPVEPPRPGNDAPMPTRGRRISSSGVAEMIEGNDGSGKYLALHRTAPIGTLVQVRNEFNNQSLWVKVIGRLPNTGVNDKILVKLSTQAFAKLSPQDRRFRAEVSYIAP